MVFLPFLPTAICLGLCLIPAWLLRRKTYTRAQEYFVSSEQTPPSVIQNSSIAYALQTAIFGPLFALGASGNFWPAIISAGCFGLGLYLMYILRRPMIDFLNDALANDRSVTIHDFIARQHGNDPRVRLLASSLTIFAFSGLAIGEALALAVFLKPLLINAGFTYAIVLGISILMALQTIPAGNSGVLRSTQLQLGMIYFGLIGSTGLLLYQLISDLRPIPPHGTFAIVFVAVCCAIMIYYRRSRYVDTSPLRSASDDADAAGMGRDPLGVRLFIRFEKILNVCISVFGVLVIVVATMGLSTEGWSTIVGDSTAALQRGTGMSGIGLLTLFLVPLFYPVVDLTNWQRIAAFERDRTSHQLAPSVRAAALRRLFRIYALESPLVFVFMCMFGTIAVLTMEPPGNEDVMQALVRQFAAGENSVIVTAFSLLLISLFAIALSTMSSLFSATLCAIRYDILPTFWPDLISDKAHAAEEATAMRRAIMVGIGLYLVICTAFCAASAYLPTVFISGIIGLVFAFHCAQLSFVPLLLGPVVARTSKGFGTVSPGWALGIISSGAALGVGAVMVYLATGNEWWLWTAVPACLGSGLALFTMARLRSEGMRSSA